MFIEKQDFVKLSLSFAVNIVFGLNVLQAHHTTTTTHNPLPITMSTAMTQASLDAYAHNARVHAIVVETLPTVRRQCMAIDFASQSTGSESMPGNVSLAIADMMSTLEAMKARVDGAHEPQ